MIKKQRIILKISGAALKDKRDNTILSKNKLLSIANQIKTLSKNYQIAIVVGGGNIWRGGASDLSLYREKDSHYMGMIATIINSYALKEVLLRNKVKTVLFSLLPSPRVALGYKPIKVKKSLEMGNVVILAGGTGQPFVSTDTGAAKDAHELNANLIVMGKDGVDGVYSDDPKKNKKAIRYNKLTLQEIINKKLKVMDMNAVEICQRNKIDILVFNIERRNAIVQALKNKIPTTFISYK
ncbi:MAG: UMP kinase [Mycoplasmataceae bacterium]|nr:UMP kinase [Mycoplasmataceae bacterium]